MSDTPRTDQVTQDAIEHGSPYNYLLLHARQLERELTAATAQTERLNARIKLLEDALGYPNPNALQQDCPHAAPFRYCPKCVVFPCPIGLGQ